MSKANREREYLRLVGLHREADISAALRAEFEPPKPVEKAKPEDEVKDNGYRGRPHKRN